MYAQTQIDKKTTSLVDIITQLEAKFKYSFSYADKNISNLSIYIPDNLSSFKEIIKYIESQTNLKFTVLEGGFVAISSKEKDGKLCGYLYDMDSEEAVENVVVRYGNSTALSDAFGYFELPLDTVTQLLGFQHLSYKNVTRKLKLSDENACQNYFLIPKIEKIKEIVIHEYLTRGIRKTILGGYDVNYKNFGALPGILEQDALHTIQALPGVQSVDESVSNINIRGGSHHENLVLWDGIKMYQSGHFFGLISSFNPFLTKKVQLTKNGTPAHLSGSVSSTVQLFTDNQVNPNFKASFGINLINADLFTDIPTGKNASIQVAARKSINELLETPTYKQYFDKAFEHTELTSNSAEVIYSNDEFSFYDVNLRWLFHPTAYDKIKVNFMLVDNNLLFLEEARINDLNEAKESNANQQNMGVGIQYERIWNNEFKSDIQLYGSKYLLNSTNVDLLNDQRLKQENEVLEEGVKLLNTYNLSNELTLFQGYDYVETGIQNVQDVDNPLYKSTIKEVMRKHGFSLQTGYLSYDENTYIRAGARLNYFEKFGKLLIEPRLSITHQFSHSFSAELLGEFKNQVTTQVIDFQNDFLGIENRRWLLANNKEIPIVKSKQISAGLNYKNDGWILSVDAYLKNVEGITSQSQGFQNQFEYEKAIGSYKVYGADVLINKKIDLGSVWINYSYAKNNYLFEDFAEMEFPNNFDLRHSISSGISYTTKEVSISAGVNWHSGRPTTNILSNEILIGEQLNYEFPNSSRLPSYFRADLSAKYRFKLSPKTKAECGIAIWNLLNTINTTNNYYKLNNGSIDHIEKRSLQFTPNVTFRLLF